MEQLVILIIIAVIAAINWILNKRQETQQAPPKQPGPRETPAPQERRPPQNEQERMRKFLEALGIPDEGSEQEAPPAPPPVVRRVREIAEPPVARRVHEVLSPPLPQRLEPPMEAVEAVVTPAMLEPEELVDQLEEVLPELQEVEELAAPDSAQVIEKPLTAAELRKAIVLRELLGPPRALQTQLQPPNVH